MNKNNKFWIVLVSILIVVNISSLALFWFGNDSADNDHRRQRRREAKTETLLKEKIGLDKKQIELFRKSRQNHFENIRPFERSLRAKKKELFQMNLQGSDISNTETILQEISLLHRKIDSLTYMHFSELRSYCREDQIQDFNRMLKSMLRKEFDGRMEMRRGKTERKKQLR